MARNHDVKCGCQREIIASWICKQLLIPLIWFRFLFTWNFDSVFLEFFSFRLVRFPHWTLCTHNFVLSTTFIINSIWNLMKLRRFYGILLCDLKRQLIQTKSKVKIHSSIWCFLLRGLCWRFVIEAFSLKMYRFKNMNCLLLNINWKYTFLSSHCNSKFFMKFLNILHCIVQNSHLFHITRPIRVSEQE